MEKPVPLMTLRLIFVLVSAAVLSSCSLRLKEANKAYLDDSTEVRDDARAEGYLVSTRKGTELWRFRGLLHERGEPRIVEIKVPENRARNAQAWMTEVDAEFAPDARPVVPLRVETDEHVIFRLGYNERNPGREWVLGKNRPSNLRLLIGREGHRNTNHFLHTDLRKVRRNDGVATMRNLGYMATVPVDVVIVPVVIVPWLIAGWAG